MTWQELPVWVKIRMLINQKIQSNVIDPSVFEKDISATKFDVGFDWCNTSEDSNYWYDTLELGKIPKETAKLYIYESTPGKYGLKMSHSDTYLYFTKQELSDLGLTNPIIEAKGSCKYHTFEEHLKNYKSNRKKWTAFKEYLQKRKWNGHKTEWDLFCTRIVEKYHNLKAIDTWLDNVEYLSGDKMIEYSLLEVNWKYWKGEVSIFETNVYNSSKEDVPTFKNVRKITTTDEINPECLAFKEWAEKQPYPEYDSLWDLFVKSVKICVGNKFTLEYWMERCNSAGYTRDNIVTAFVPITSETFWRQILYQKSHPKSPAEIFIEWALKEEINTFGSKTVGDIYLSRNSCTKDKFIELYKNHTMFNIYRAVGEITSMSSTTLNKIESRWFKYLKTINNDQNQLQGEEIPESSGSGAAGLRSYDRDVLIEASGCDCNFEAGYEISGEGIDVSEADLSFGFDCSL